jgi:hypothetical protein
MKIFYSNLLSCIFFGFIIGLSDCNNGDNNPDNGNQNPDPQTVAKTNLTSGTWNLLFATRDDINVNSDFDGFNMTFTTTGYSVEEGGTALSGTGSWQFDGISSTTIILDGNLSVAIEFSNNNNNLRLTFTIPETDYSLGRTEKLQGTYIFDLVKS